jgi:WD40 repeat protein
VTQPPAKLNDTSFVCSDGTIKIWEAETGACLHNLLGHTSRVWDVSSAPSGLFLASASGDATAMVPSRLQLHTPHLHVLPRRSLVTCRFSSSLSLSLSKLWDLGRQAVVSTKTFKGHEGDVYTVHFHPGEVNSPIRARSRCVSA